MNKLEKDKENISIFFASDDNYCFLLAVSICSILYNTSKFINFYILEDNVAEFHKKQIKSLKNKFNNFDIEFISIDAEKIFSNLKITNNYPTFSIYSRFLIPDLKPNINKAIYLDCDTIVLDDVCKLYEENLEEYILGAVPEHEYYDVVIKLKENIQNSKDHLYFNSGVLLIDCNRWRNENITKSILNISLSNLLCPDQDLLNKYFDNNYKVLSYKYNLKSADIFQNNFFKSKNQSNLVIEEIEKYRNSPIIKHFNSPDKAWIKNKGLNNIKIKFFEDFWFFAKMTPFYEGLLNNFNVYSFENVDNETKYISYRKMIKLFNLIPIIRIKITNNRKKIYLFNFLPILTIKG